MRRRMRMVAALVLAFALLGASPAAAAPTTQVVQGQVLRLVSTADWEVASSLVPGQRVQWDVAVSADAPDPGTVDIGISATGDADLAVDVAICLREWEPDGCPGGATVVRSAWDLPRDGEEVHLADIADTEVAHVRLTIVLAGDDALGSTQVRVHAAGAGESASVGPDGGLATTGLSPVVPWSFAAAAALIVLGVVLMAVRHRTRRGEDGGA
jgi:hypothetical protein